MTKEQYEEAERLSAELKNLLKQAFATGDPAGELAQKTADLHRQWLCCFGKVTAKKPMPGLPKCMLRTRGLRHIMTRSAGNRRILRMPFDLYGNEGRMILNYGY